MADLQPPPTWALPIDVDEATGKAQFSPVWLKWFIDLAETLNDAGGTAITHNALAGLQGGTTNEYYHFTQTEHTALAIYAASLGPADLMAFAAAYG